MSSTVQQRELWLTCHNLTEISKDVFKNCPNLTVFGCNKNYLKKLPAIPKTVTELFCNDNCLKRLPKLPPSLRVLNCSGNRGLTLAALPNTLVILHCSEIGLSELPDLPPTLQTLGLYGNPLEENYPELDLSRGNVRDVAAAVSYINACNRLRRMASGGGA